MHIISSTKEAERRITVPDQSRQKVSKALSQTTSQPWKYATKASDIWKTEV
jgi:hypothetical protein